MSLRFCSVGLMDIAVMSWQLDLGIYVDSLSMAFNYLTDVGLRELLRQAPRVGNLDLEGNAMEFNLMSEGVDLLWKEGSNFLHLNALCNNSTRQSFVHVFWEAGGSSLET